MEQSSEDTGEIVERGLRRKSQQAQRLRIKPSTKPVRKGSGRKIVMSKPKGFKLAFKLIVPLNLYYSDKYKDYFSTTSVRRGKQAMQGAGQYHHVGIQGYVYTQSMYKRLPNSLRSRTIPMYSYYNNQTRDNLIATGPGDIQDAKKRGYKQIALEGYLIKPGTPPPTSCKVKTDCPSSHYCDIKQGVCRPDIR
jgi:hypothetical protein